MQELDFAVLPQNCFADNDLLLDILKQAAERLSTLRDSPK